MFVNIVTTWQIKYLQVYLSASGKLYSLIQAGQEPSSVWTRRDKEVVSEWWQIESFNSILYFVPLLSEKV